MDGSLLLEANLYGLRDLIGRYASMANEGVVAIQRPVAEALEAEIKREFHEAAPYRIPVPGAPVHEHFNDSFSTSLDVRRTTPQGFFIELDTSQGDVAGYLFAGAYPISSPTGKTLHFFEYSGPVSVPAKKQPVHWFTRHQHWEDDALARCSPLIEMAGAEICRTVAYKLTNG